MKNFKIITLFCVCFTVLGCSNFDSDIEKTKTLPKELSDCKFISLGYEHNYLKVIRCPNSSTLTQQVSQGDIKLNLIIEKNLTLK